MKKIMEKKTMDKQKQIDEMAKVMENWAVQNGMLWHEGHAKALAEVLLKEYQPKIPEGAVVLTKEEHQKYLAFKLIEPQIRGCLDREQKLEKQVRELAKELNLAKSVLSYDDERPLEKWAEHLRKEAVEKFAEKLKARKVRIATPARYVDMVYVEDIDEIAKEITEGKDDESGIGKT